MSQWTNFQKSLLRYPDLGFSLDTSLMDAPATWSPEMEEKIARAHRDRIAIEAGEIMNPDEGRAVGHYWLRNPALAPPSEAAWIRTVKEQVQTFAAQVLSGEITNPSGETFRHVLLIGIGGSALGPQLVSKALVPAQAPIDLLFCDNTDPGGMDDIFLQLGDGLAETMVVIISKSGGTAETRNGMLETEAEFQRRGLYFAGNSLPR